MSTRKPGHVTHKQLCLRIALNHGGECSHDQIVTTAAISCNSSLACHAVALAKAGHFSCTTEDTKTTKKTNQEKVEHAVPSALPLARAIGSPRRADPPSSLACRAGALSQAGHPPQITGVNRRPNVRRSYRPGRETYRTRALDDAYHPCRSMSVAHKRRPCHCRQRHSVARACSQGAIFD